MKKFFFLSFLALVILCGTAFALKQTTKAFNMPKDIATNMRYVIRLSGMCGQKCRNGPENMYTASFGRTLLVAYQTISPVDKFLTVGHVATFNMDNTGGSTLVSDIEFPFCYKMGGIATNEAGTVIGILCRGLTDSHSNNTLKGKDPAGTISFIDKYRDNGASGCNDWQGRCYPIGWYSDLDSPLYLLEFRGGKVTKSPNSIVLINHASGGWNYGHLSIELNKDSTRYFVDLKVTAGPSVTNRHEGNTHFGINRSDWTRVSTKETTDGWACGPGHTIANRLAYNKAIDSFARYCMIDTRHEVRYGTTPTPSNSDALILSPDPGTTWIYHGGSMNIVSLGARGWMASGVGPEKSQYTSEAEMKVGVIKLPPRHSQFNAATHKWKWFNIPAPTSTKFAKKAGLVNMAHFGAGGENGNKLLVGWSPSVAFQGIADEYLVQEMDTNGNLLGKPLKLANAAWGEDNEWQYIPATGCVAFPFAWMGAPGNNFPIHGSATSTKTLQLTTICPDVPIVPTPSTPAPTPAPTPSADPCVRAGSANVESGVWYHSSGYVLTVVIFSLLVIGLAVYAANLSIKLEAERNKNRRTGQTDYQPLLGN